MRITKEQALEWIDGKLALFKVLLEKPCKQGVYDEEFRKALGTTQDMLNHLYEGKGDEFNAKILNAGVVYTKVSRVSLLDENRTREKRLRIAITHLEGIKERIERYWEIDAARSTTSKKPVPFVSKSFADEDKAVNEYFEGILVALSIHFLTGEEYSSESIPQKVESEIDKADLLIAIVTRRDKKENDHYTVPPWITREVFFAKGRDMDFIILMEDGVEELAGLRGEKELIYFTRTDLKKMQQATLKFLEALRVHNLV